MTRLILDDEDPRCVRALLLAVTADTWPQREKDGHTWYLVPSQSEKGMSYMSDGVRCGCPDHTRRERRKLEDQRCKHCIAVQIYQFLLRAADQTAPKTRRPTAPPEEPVRAF